MAPTEAWLGAMNDAMEPWDAGRYLNFSDEDEDIAVAFPPETVDPPTRGEAKLRPGEPLPRQPPGRQRLARR